MNLNDFELNTYLWRQFFIFQENFLSRIFFSENTGKKKFLGNFFTFWKKFLSRKFFLTKFQEKLFFRRNFFHEILNKIKIT